MESWLIVRGRYTWLHLLVLLLVVMACGGDREALTHAVQATDTEAPAWGSGASLTVSLRTPTRIRLGWPAATDDEGVVSYKVYRGPNPAATLAASQTTWTDTGQLPSTSLSYTVTAVDAANNEVAWSNALTVSTSTQAPSSAPTWTSGAALSVARIGKRRVHLHWDGATDDYGELRYEVRVLQGVNLTTSVTLDGADGEDAEWTSPVVLSPNTAYSFEVRALDYEGNVTSPALTTTSTTHAVTDLPEWDSGAALTATRAGWSAISAAATGVGLDAAQFHWQHQQDTGAWVDWGDTSGPTNNGDLFAPGSTWSVRVMMVDQDDVSSTPLSDSVEMPLPAEPEPPALDRTRATDLMDTARYLFESTGSSEAVQEGMNSTALTRARVAVVRGRVMTRSSGAALSSVRVSVPGHAEFGQTFTRSDGRFDFVLNGGGPVTLVFQGAGLLDVQRTVNVRWQEQTDLGDVAMTQQATSATTLTMSASQMTWQQANGAAETDSDGTRQATVMIPPGTTATMRMPDGSTEALPSTAHLRITEFTVGEHGREAMPGSLPPQIAYTWAADFAFDEAAASNAVRVDFNHPVPMYVDNFIDFPVGESVPVGYYDEQRSAWLASEHGNGIVLKVLATDDSGGAAQLDLDGDNDWDSADQALADVHGIDAAERTALRARVGASTAAELWRVRLGHFSKWDCNWGVWPPDTAKAPYLDGIGDQHTKDHMVCRPGSVIACQNRALGETIPVRGTPFTLNYWSDRTAGRQSTLDVPVGQPAPGDTTLPAGLLAIVVEVNIAGVVQTERYTTGLLNRVHRVHWSGLGPDGRRLQGAQPVTVRVGYSYAAQYARVDRFGYDGAGTPVTSNDARNELTLWSTWEGTIGGWDAQAMGLGGWTLDVQHSYDPVGRTVQFGSGGERAAASVGPIVTNVIGRVGGSWGEGVAVADASVAPMAVTTGPDGSVWFSEDGRIRRITAAGTVLTVAGTGSAGCGADGSAPTASAISGVYSMQAVGERLYFSEYGCHRIRYIDSLGIHTLVGINETGGFNGDGAVGTETQIFAPAGLRFSEDGSFLVFADMGNRRVRRYDFSDARVRTIAGDGEWTFAGDNVPATSRSFWGPAGVDVGPDGGVYFTDVLLNRVFYVGINGRVRDVAGTNTGGFSGEGEPATTARLLSPWSVRRQPGGVLLIGDTGNARIRAIAVNGNIYTIVGTGATGGFNGFGRAGALTNLSSYIFGMELAPDGSLLIPDATTGHVMRYAFWFPGFLPGTVQIPSADGGELYTFDAMTGCHLHTDDAVTRRRHYTFVHDAGTCLLTSVQIGPAADGNTVAIHRASGTSIQIRSPFYAESGEQTELTLDGGYLTSVHHAGAEWAMEYTTLGLLTRFEDPLTQVHTFTYSTDDGFVGMLATDTGPTGTTTTLTTQTGSTASDFAVRTVTGASGAVGPGNTHQVTHRPTGRTDFYNSSPAGSAGAYIGSLTAAYPDNHEESLVTQDTTTLSSSRIDRSPDPRLGGAAPFVSRSESTVAGRTVATDYTRDVTVNTSDTLLVETQIDTATVDGESDPRITTRYDRAHSDCGGSARLLRTTRGGRQTRTCLDAQQRVASVQVVGASPALEPVLYHYDARGRVDRVTQGTRAVQTGYNSDGRVGSVAAGTWSGSTFTALATTSTTWNATTRRPTVQALPGSREVGLNLDAMGQLNGLTPPGRSEHTMTYDGAGRMTGFTSPAPSGGAGALNLAWAYNARGQLTSHTRADSSVVDFDYDEPATGYEGTGHLSWVTWPGIGTTTYGYRTATGAVNRVSGPQSCELTTLYESASYPYEPLAVGESLGSVTSLTCPVQGSVKWEINGLFEPAAMVVGNPASGGLSVDFTWDDDDDRLLTAVEGMTLTPDAATGRLSGTAVGVVATGRTYTSYGELATETSAVSSSPELAFEYGYDALGRIESIAESGHTTRTVGYSYDSAGRLYQVTHNSGADGGVVVDEEYTYSGTGSTGGPNGNRTAWTVGGVNYTATYDAQDRLSTMTPAGGATTTFAYDAHGNMTSRSDGTTTANYTWDPRGALTQVTRTGAQTVDYVLDPLGRRIGRKVAGVFKRGWLYQGIHPVAELGTNGSTIERVFVYASRGHSPDLVIQRRGTSWVTYRVLSDHLGSVRAVVRASDGFVMQRMEYDAFGRVVTDFVATGTGADLPWTPIPFGYAGGLYERNTGLVRFGAREYDPTVGRWLSRDPLQLGGGDNNAYAYVGGEPVNHIDPSGLFSVNDLAAIIPGLNLLAAGIHERAEGTFEMGSEATVDSGSCRVQRGAAMIGLGGFATGMFAALTIGVFSMAIGPRLPPRPLIVEDVGLTGIDVQLHGTFAMRGTTATAKFDYLGGSIPPSQSLGMLGQLMNTARAEGATVLRVETSPIIEQTGSLLRVLRSRGFQIRGNGTAYAVFDL